MALIIREFLKLYGPLALAIVLASLWFLHSRDLEHLNAVRLRQPLILEREAAIIDRAVNGLAADARLLARLAADRLDGLPGPALERIFSDFARTRPHSLMVRFIDNRGMERVRVDQAWSGPVVAPSELLQDKGERYYVREALRIDPGSVFVSDFDLNVEQGRIEVPHRPTLRFASPVVDAGGSVVGAVVINYDGRHLLDQVKRAGASGEGLTLLCDARGFWIIGPATDEEWGRDLGRPDATMAVRFPEAWRAVAGQEEGQTHTPEGLFSFVSIHVAQDADGPGAADWRLMTWVPPAVLSLPWATPFTGLAVLFLLTLVPGCWFLASYRVRQAEVEARLRESEARTLAISRSAQDAVVMIDDQGRVTFWNPAAERLFGYPAGEIMGRRLHSLLAPEEMRARAEAGMAGFARSGRGHVVGRVVELDALRRDGSTVPVEVGVASVQLDGRWYAVGTLRDMTRRKRYEAALRRSEETSRTLLNAPDHVAMLIEPNGSIAAINETGARLYGQEAEAMIGRTLFEFLSGERAEALRTILREIIEQARPSRFEATRDGRRYLASVYPVTGPDGAVEQVAIFARDITEQRLAQAALQRSEQRFRDVSAAVGEFIWETDADGIYTFVTDDVFSVLGRTAEELLGRSPAVFIAPDQTDDFVRWQTDVYARREPFSKVELRCVTRDGRTVWLQSSGVPYRDEEGRFGGYRGADMDISERKRAEEIIKASERKLRALAESAYDAIVMIDGNARVSFWNPAAERLFGFAEDEAMGRAITDLITPPELREKTLMTLRQLAGGDGPPSLGTLQETEAVRKDGTRLPVERSVSSFRLGGAWYAVATIRDITERKTTEARLRELATTDSLTGLYNRRRFMELAEREFVRSRRYQGALTMLMMDIDHFKRVNDTHGHDVGDEVLRELAHISRVTLREPDVLGRLGGEEFGVLLPETDAAAALEVAERLRRAIEDASMVTAAGEMRITVSIGAAASDADADSVATLLKRADVALYAAKEAGRNRVVAG
ncbi:PAS domain S-box protein [Pseudodesulfovibrio sp. F-1]|uniref:PAS domain S-box protein n=1 Tax=Pseudodesulfovibrio alkaliphilus TaxID=2661613 RepID=A0A7K1KME2_9BACT|nr:PAS domain S-box protein [Pseudodesulfovibrio alkaliphilus]MUM77264.1 PAS domain S-box protein [Pseudodesulfovibrio alkaliphilus]